MCVQGFSRPVQCSEDVPEQSPSFQTGREVSVTSGSALSTPNLQTDAERVDQSRPSHGGDAAVGGAPDVITIKGKSIGCLTTFFFLDGIWKHTVGERDPYAWCH